MENWIQTYDTEMGEKQVIAGNDFSLTLELFPQFLIIKSVTSGNSMGWE